MSGFYLVNEKRFPLPSSTVIGNAKGNVNVDMLPYYRWEHRVTVGYNGRRYMVFLDNLKNTTYIEEVTNGLEKIEDDELWGAIVNFAIEHKYLDMLLPMMKDKKERFV